VGKGRRIASAFGVIKALYGDTRYGSGNGPTHQQSEALRMLAGSPLGSTVSIFMAHGFEIGTLKALVRSGLATAERR
jgi:hypothetical protein